MVVDGVFVEISKNPFGAVVDSLRAPHFPLKNARFSCAHAPGKCEIVYRGATEEG